MAELSPPRGTQDLLPPDADTILGLVLEAHEAARRHGFRYVETPGIEHTEIFERTAGGSSDVVTKEMYTFEDKGGRSLTLKPESTAPVVRAFLARRQDLPTPFKAYYVGPNWRHGRPQAGRLREFRVFGVEILGAGGPAADVETIVLSDGYLRARGLHRFSLAVNSIGDEVCRPAYRERLVAYLEEHRDELCRECRERIHTNPLRTFDCKEEGCRAVMADAPLIPDHLCEPCREHFDHVRAGLESEGLAFELDPRLVRGLDYYTRTTFEFVSEVLSPAQATVCGGGRYDGLSEVLGGEPTAAVGFGMGLDRVVLALEGEGVAAPSARTPSCFVVGLGARGGHEVRALVRDLRQEGIAADAALEDRPLKAQLRMADRAGARFAAILGDRELEEGVVTMRRMEDGSQETVPRTEVAAWLRR